MKKQYTLDDFEGIVRTLRGEHGCAWDRRQTHASLKPFITEEAAELVSSVRIYEKTGNAENMKEELGDILLHIVLHAQIAEEEGLFTLEDVIEGISEKMIRRHPYVFHPESGGPEQVSANWEEIKQKEKEGKEWIESPLREIPQELPALIRTSKVLKKADRLYGTGKSFQENAKRLMEAVDKMSELRPEREDERLQEIFGDMLMSLSEIAAQYRIPSEQILTDRIEDFIERYEPM